jgi:hypothetical protein
MQRMKSNSAAIRVKHWCSEKVVKVYDHGENHNNPYFQVIVFVKKPGCQSRNNKMKYGMKDWADHVFSVLSYPVVIPGTDFIKKAKNEYFLPF